MDRVLPVSIVSLLVAIAVAMPGPAGALSCVGVPDDYAEALLTGVTGVDGGWYADIDGAALIGEIVDGTPDGNDEVPAGERLALVDVRAGVRLDDPPAQVEIVMSDFGGWGHPHYEVGQIVLIPARGERDLHGTISTGPCSDIVVIPAGGDDRLFDLAAEAGTELTAPDRTPPTTTRSVPDGVAPTTTAATTVVSLATTTPTAEPTPDDRGAGTILAFAAVALVIAAGVGGFAWQKRRS